MAFEHTLSAAVQGVIGLLLVVLTGFVFQRTVKLFDSRLGGLSQLIFKLLLPCLLFASVSRAMSVDAISTLAGALAFAVGGSAFGHILGYYVHLLYVCIWPAGASPVFGEWLTAACVGVMNQGYTGLSIIPAVLLLQPFGEDRDTDEDTTLAVSVISMYLMVLNLDSWTAVHWMVRKQKAATYAAYPALEPTHVLSVTPDEPAESDAPEGPCPVLQRVGRAIGGLITPPIAGCLAGIILGLIPPIKALLHAEDEDDIAPLQPTVTSAITSLGDTVVPIVLLQLGATMHDLAFGKPGVDEATATQGGELHKPAPATTAAGHEGSVEQEIEGASAEKEVEVVAAEAVVVVEWGAEEEGAEVDSEGKAQPAATPASPQPAVSEAVVASAGIGGTGVSSDALDGGAAPAKKGMPAGLLALVVVLKLVVMPLAGLGIVSLLLSVGAIDTSTTSPVLPFLFMFQWAPPTALNLLILGEMEDFALVELSTVVFATTLGSAVSMTMWITVGITVVNGFYGV